MKAKIFLSLFLFITLSNITFSKTAKSKDEINKCVYMQGVEVTCPNGQKINIGVFAVEYNCTTGEYITHTFTPTNKTCASAGELIYELNP